MAFTFDGRASDSPYVKGLWQTQSERAGSFTSTAGINWEMVVVRYQGKTSLTVRGPETKASSVDFPADVEFFGITFKLGSFMPHLPISDLLDRKDATLPEAASNSFWLHGSAWQFPDYNNADTFVDRLVRQGLLVHDPVVDAALQDQPPYLSLRSVQYRFLRATGMTHSTVRQIERARLASALLVQGVPILDVVHEAGYSDQPHLTRSLKRFMGQTPAQIAQLSMTE